MPSIPSTERCIVPGFSGEMLLAVTPNAYSGPRRMLAVIYCFDRGAIARHNGY